MGLRSYTCKIVYFSAQRIFFLKKKINKASSFLFTIKNKKAKAVTYISVVKLSMFTIIFVFEFNSTISCPKIGIADNRFVITVAKPLINLLVNQKLNLFLCYSKSKETFRLIYLIFLDSLVINIKIKYINNNKNKGSDCTLSIISDTHQ